MRRRRHAGNFVSAPATVLNRRVCHSQSSHSLPVVRRCRFASARQCTANHEIDAILACRLIEFLCRFSPHSRCLTGDTRTTYYFCYTACRILLTTSTVVRGNDTSYCANIALFSPFTDTQLFVTRPHQRINSRLNNMTCSPTFSVQLHH